MKFTVAFIAAFVAVNGSPVAMPQGVTQQIAPSAPAPSGCMTMYSGSFGVAVQNVTAGGAMMATQLPDGQPQATNAPVSQIPDGQPQASTGVAPVSQIPDGQIQASTAAPVSQIPDGQIQATKSMPAVSQIGDGQIQATKSMPAVTQISDGQIQATKSAPAVSQISDGQIQATGTGAQQISDGQVQATGAPAPPPPAGGMPPKMVACSSDTTLTMTLEGGVLKDAQGRIGYIASNYQFQFDGPPQAGAIYTSGWSVCGNGSLALGGSTTFYQCLSGDFYNLYNENWAPQCNAVTIDVLELVPCS